MALSDLFIDAASLPGGAYGYVQLAFLLIVYGYILFKASKCIADGSELLTLVMNPGLVGGLLLPVMGAVPDGAIVLFSGLGPDAQEQLNVGVGTLAGSTIMLLTIPYAASIYLGRVDLSPDGSKALYKQNPKLTKPASDVRGTGIQPTKEIPRSAVLMLLTAITYLFVQGPSWAHDSASVSRGFALAGLIMSVIAFLSYSAYCLMSASAIEAQKARGMALRKRALADKLVGFSTMLRIEEELAADALAKEAAGDSEAGLMPGAAPGDATPATSAALRRLFEKYDANGNGSIDAAELKAMVTELGLPRMSGSELTSLMKDVGGSDMAIQFDEFAELVTRFAHGTVQHHDSIRQVHSTVSHKDDNEDDDEDDDEEEEEEDHAMTPNEIRAKALFLLVAGVGLVTFFSDPMVDVLATLGNRMDIKPFYVSFVISPLVSNASELISAIVFAGRKTAGSMDMTLSALLGAATMNNTFCLAIFLAIVYIRDLSWAFSAEVTSILVCQCAIAALAYRSRPTPTWMAVFPLAMYPFSLFLVWFLESVVGWN